MITDVYCLPDTSTTPFTGNLQLWSPAPSRVTFNYNVTRVNNQPPYRHYYVMSKTSTPIQQQEEAREEDEEEDDCFYMRNHYYEQEACTFCGLSHHQQQQQQQQQHRRQHYHHSFNTITSSSSFSVHQQQQMTPSHTQLATTDSDLLLNIIPATLTAPPDLIITPAPSFSCSALKTVKGPRKLNRSPYHSSYNMDSYSHDGNNKNKLSLKQYMHTVKRGLYKYYKGYQAMLLQPPVIIKKK
ncbi:hypothetical protein BDF20DRAFT_833949 [Mycotypha africana]|uniref:uncharacterized protein n=1 Tax=Mycotypha africana TaxID=64632 RepID=UPI00230121F7|nr:uncharacterized protein BDF20DRAFT_833949 [Mycotypha africana]KAI8984442.1 hypothetical protein BDF20DRAFT_833949 [Mycotypha africana]